MGLTTREFAERPPLKGWMIAVGALLLLLVVALLAKGCGGDNASDVQGQDGNQPTQSQQGKGSVLPQRPQLQRSPHDRDWLTAAPHRISWQRVDGVPFPFSDSDGPMRIDGAVATGYSHTPQGAVLAAAHISFRLAWSPDYQAVLDAQTVVEDSTRTALISARSHSGSVDPEMIAAVAKAPTAFKVERYTPATATVYLAFSTESDKYRFAPVAVTWQDGDWKYSDALDASTPSLPDSDSLDGFTTFGEDK